MTTDLEKQFFSTFGIERVEKSYCLTGYCSRKPTSIKFSDCEICRNCKNGKFYYVPEITDRHYLELISKLSGVTKPHFVFERGVEELKHDILEQCMFYKKELEFQVRTLFEEG